jgi:hypothetical protein
MSYEQHFEGDDSKGTWRAPDSARYVPRVRRERTTIRIKIRVPEAPIKDITDEPQKPEQPPITFEGGDAADAINAERRRKEQEQNKGYSPELLEQWRKDAERLRKNKMN